VRAILLRCAVAFCVLCPVTCLAEPSKLKLAFFSSDSALLYRGGVKPFVDAVNSEKEGGLEIEVFFGGALGKVPAQQPQLVRDGSVDIAYIIPGYSAEQFPDNAVIVMNRSLAPWLPRASTRMQLTAFRATCQKGELRM